MIYDVVHTTRYKYAGTVTRCQNQLHLTPRTTPFQRPLNARIHIDPPPSVRSGGADAFGNTVTYAEVSREHGTLSITARSRVELSTDERLMPAQMMSWEQLAAWTRRHEAPESLHVCQFVFNSPMIRAAEAYADYARPSFSAKRPVLEAVTELNTRIYSEFKYDPQATSVATPVGEVMEQRSGVCQDFAHAMIACLRSLGLPARYVSGYLRTHHQERDPELRGASASHAWVSVYVPGIGWIDFDPTNNMLPCRPNVYHVTLAWGRDYTDVAPVKGVVLGGGKHAIGVSVDVTPAA